MASLAVVQLPPLTKQSMAKLVATARRMGVEPGVYAKRLIEEGLAFAREAEESSFAQIMKPVRDVAGEIDDALIRGLVETARANRSASARRKKK